jgi:hypothetical protein
MERMRKFLRLPSTDRRLLVEAWVLLGAIRLGLRLLSFQTLRSLLARMSGPPPAMPEADQASMERVAWAVSVASWHIPGVSTCLVQALAAQVLLGRRGHAACLRIGVERTTERGFLAHAWVESQGKAVVGGEEPLSRYTPLPSLEWKRP